MNPIIICRLYVLAALAAAGLLAPLVYAPVPWLMLAGYIYLSFNLARRGLANKQTFAVAADVLLVLSLPLFFTSLLPAWLVPLLSLPVLPLLDESLRRAAAKLEVTPLPHPGLVGKRRLTSLTVSLALTVVLSAGLALALGTIALLLNAALLAVYLLAAIGVVLFQKSRRFPVSPVTVEKSRHRVVAGSHAGVAVKLKTSVKAPFAGHLSVYSLYPWFFLRPDRVVLDKPEIELQASFTPPLAGPDVVNVAAVFVDPWGLTRFDFTLEIMELLVIPRARYAEWLARRYLETGRSAGGIVPAMTVASPRRSSRQGIEFYGLRPYQPGDSSRSIDWKHSSKLRRFIVKEFMDKSTESAVIAVNLSVTDEEEKDVLVSGLITAALTMARENIPSALAAYDHESVVKTTPLLDPLQALIQALSLTREVKLSPAHRRYLAVPDAGRLRANIQRLGRTEGTAAARLGDVLRLEYAALAEEARQNPATAALSGALAGLKSKANILTVSARNHDAAAIAFNRHILEAKGYRFIDRTATF